MNIIARAAKTTSNDLKRIARQKYARKTIHEIFLGAGKVENGSF